MNSAIVTAMERHFLAGKSPEQVGREFGVPAEKVRTTLGIYDLSTEPPKPDKWCKDKKLRNAWEAECRRLNPKAWEMKKAL